MRFAPVSAVLATLFLAACNSSSTPPNDPPPTPAPVPGPCDGIDPVHPVLAPGDSFGRHLGEHLGGVTAPKVSVYLEGSGEALDLTAQDGCTLPSLSVWVDGENQQAVQSYGPEVWTGPMPFGRYDPIDRFAWYAFPATTPNWTHTGDDKRLPSVITTATPGRWVVEGVDECDGGLYQSWLAIGDAGETLALDRFWEDDVCDLRRGDILPGTVNALHLAPDGATLVWAVTRRDADDDFIDNKIFRYDIDAGGTPEQVAEFAARSVIPSRFSHNGDFVALRPDGNGVLLAMYRFADGEEAVNEGLASFEFVDLDDPAESVTIDPQPAAGNRLEVSLRGRKLPFDARGALWLELAEGSSLVPGQIDVDTETSPLRYATVADPTNVIELSDPDEVLIRDYFAAPDRGWVAWLATQADRSVCRVSVSEIDAAATPVVLADDLDCAVFDDLAGSDIEWVRDGSGDAMLVVTKEQGVQTLFTVTGGVVESLDFESDRVGAPILSPDGLYVYFAAGMIGEGELRRLRIASGEVEVLAETGASGPVVHFVR